MEAHSGKCNWGELQLNFAGWLAFPNFPILAFLCPSMNAPPSTPSFLLALRPQTVAARAKQRAMRTPAVARSAAGGCGRSADWGANSKEGEGGGVVEGRRGEDFGGASCGAGEQLCQAVQPNPGTDLIQMNLDPCSFIELNEG